VSGSADKTVCLWDAQTGLQLGNSLTGHRDIVSSVAFLPDGKRVVSGSFDKTIRIWDAEGNQQFDNSPHIKFSPMTSHSLANVQEFLHGTMKLQKDWKDQFSLENDGWIVGPQGQLLMWVPISDDCAFYSPRAQLIIANNAVALDTSAMVHGRMWDQCYIVTT
jgi:WD40 repeat protein